MSGWNSTYIGPYIVTYSTIEDGYLKGSIAVFGGSGPSYVMTQEGLSDYIAGISQYVAKEGRS